MNRKELDGLGKELLMMKYATNFGAFMTEVLGMDYKWFHKEWINNIKDNELISIMAPRGSGKSVLVGSYIVWRILKDPTIRILQVTINQDKAQDMMTFVQQCLTRNEIITNIWGDVKDPTEWSKTSIRVLAPGKRRKGRESTLSVVGVNASMVGGHYELIVLDDIVDNNNSRTEHKRNELLKWYRNTLTPMIEPTGKVVAVNTKWHELDLTYSFSKMEDFKQVIYKSIIFEPSEEQKEQGMEPKVLWPERFPYSKLMSIKKQIGTAAFHMQYQNEVVSDETAIIKWDWLRRANEGFRMIERPYSVYMGVDLSSKGKETDWFSISVIGIKDGLIYLIDAFRGDMTLSQQLDKILEYDNKWRPTRIGIDSAAQQKSIVEDIIEKNPAIPLHPIKPSIINDKMSRIQRLSVLFEGDRIFLDPRFDYYCDELASAPNGAYDDAMDSLSFSIESSMAEANSHGVYWDAIPTLITTSNNVKTRGTSKAPKPQKFNMIKVN